MEVNSYLACIIARSNRCVQRASVGQSLSARERPFSHDRPRLKPRATVAKPRWGYPLRRLLRSQWVGGSEVRGQRVRGQRPVGRWVSEQWGSGQW